MEDLKVVNIKRMDERYNKEFYLNSNLFVDCISKKKFKTIKNKRITYECIYGADEELADAKMKVGDKEVFLFKNGSIPKILFKPIGYLAINHSDLEYVALMKQRKSVYYMILILEIAVSLVVILFLMWCILFFEVGGL